MKMMGFFRHIQSNYGNKLEIFKMLNTLYTIVSDRKLSIVKKLSKVCMDDAQTVVLLDTRGAGGLYLYLGIAWWLSKGRVQECLLGIWRRAHLQTSTPYYSFFRSRLYF